METKKPQHREQLPAAWGKKAIFLVARYSSVIFKIPSEGIDVARCTITGGDTKVTTKPIWLMTWSFPYLIGLWFYLLVKLKLPGM